MRSADRERDETIPSGTPIRTAIADRLEHEIEVRRGSPGELDPFLDDQSQEVGEERHDGPHTPSDGCSKKSRTNGEAGWFLSSSGRPRAEQVRREP